MFWFAQAVGIFTALAITVFVGGNVIGELVDGLITIGEHPLLFVILLCEIMVIVSFVISWNRKRLGAFMVVGFVILIDILWGKDSANVIFFHLPVLFAGLLLVFYSYYKEWILRQKP